MLDELNNFIPETRVSPIQLAKMHGKERQRASGERLKTRSQDDSEW